jgi:hypothetical protein
MQLEKRTFETIKLDIRRTGLEPMAGSSETKEFTDSNDFCTFRNDQTGVRTGILHGMFCAGSFARERIDGDDFARPSCPI